MDQSLQIYPVASDVPGFTYDQVTDILLHVEKVRPEEITRPDQLLAVGPYSFAQIRLAIAQKALTYVSRASGGSVYRTMKPLPQECTATLRVRYPYGIQNKEESLPQDVYLEISTPTRYVLEMDFPILEPEDGFDAVSVRINDFRTFPHKITCLYDMQRKPATLEQIQHLWSGLRFLCRNLRKWDQPGIIWPEDV